MAQSDIRRYEARAASTDTFGRVMCSVREHHFVIDGPEQNGCPGEEITPGELFLSAVASCGVELIQVLAKSEGDPLQGIQVEINGSFQAGARGCITIQLRKPPVPVERRYRRRRKTSGREIQGQVTAVRHGR